MNHVTKNITFDADGFYRWAYELNLYKNPTIIFLIWKIFGFILLGLWLFMVLLEFIDDSLSLETLLDISEVMLLFGLGFGGAVPGGVPGLRPDDGRQVLRAL